MQKNHTVRTLLAAGAAAAMFSAFGVQAQTAQPMYAQGATQLSAADRQGMMDMAITNMAEIQTAKMALSKSQNDGVKTFARQMIDDHGKNLSELQTLAQQKGVSLPTELDAKHKAMAAKLEKLSGEEFNKQYMQMVGLKAHKSTLDRLQEIARTATDPAVKAAAQKTIPVVEQHLRAAQAMTRPEAGIVSGK